MAKAHPADFAFRIEGEHYVFEAHQRVRAMDGDNSHWDSLNFDHTITCCKTWTNFRRQLIMHLYVADGDRFSRNQRLVNLKSYFRYKKPIALRGQIKPQSGVTTPSASRTHTHHFAEARSHANVKAQHVGRGKVHTFLGLSNQFGDQSQPYGAAVQSGSGYNALANDSAVQIRSLADLCAQERAAPAEVGVQTPKACERVQAQLVEPSGRVKRLCTTSGRAQVQSQVQAQAKYAGSEAGSAADSQSNTKRAKKSRASPLQYLEDRLEAMAKAHPDDFAFGIEADHYVFEVHQRVRGAAHWTGLNFDSKITCCKTWTNFRRQLRMHLYLADSDKGGQRTKRRTNLRAYFRYIKPVALRGQIKPQKPERSTPLNNMREELCAASSRRAVGTGAKRQTRSFTSGPTPEPARVLEENRGFCGVDALGILAAQAMSGDLNQPTRSSPPPPFTASGTAVPAPALGMGLMQNQVPRPPNPIGARSTLFGVRAYCKKFKAEIWHGGNLHNLGTFDTKEEAAFAYDMAARKHGETQRLNYDSIDTAESAVANAQAEHALARAVPPQQLQVNSNFTLKSVAV
jgi:hypothetical protein